MAERDSFSSTALADITDRSIHAAVGRYTAGLSPMAIGGAYLDWLSHLAFSPGKQQLLVQKAVRKAVRLASYAARANDGAAPCIEPLPQDHRFDDPAWKAWPFNVIHQAFLLEQQLWHNAMTGVRGVSARNERVVEFGTRQWLDMFSPSNFPLTNPVLMERTVREAGLNFAQGARNFLMLAGARQVKIHGEYVPIRAAVRNFDALSAHADAAEIVDWLRHFERPPGPVFLTHGEPDACDALRTRISEALGWEAEVPEYLSAVALR